MNHISFDLIWLYFILFYFTLFDLIWLSFILFYFTLFYSTLFDFTLFDFTLFIPIEIRYSFYMIHNAKGRYIIFIHRNKIVLWVDRLDKRNIQINKLIHIYIIQIKEYHVQSFSSICNVQSFSSICNIQLDNIKRLIEVNDIDRNYNYTYRNGK
jgi:hypothetical protein